MAVAAHANESRVRLWTLQTEAIALALESGTPFVSKPDFEIHWGQDRQSAWGFRQAYAWMAARMRDRMGPAPQGVEHPVWAWARPPSPTQSGAPDLRSMRYEDANALIELDVPASSVVLSNFGTWHSVLNGWPNALTEEAQDALEAKVFEIRKKNGRVEKKTSLLDALDYADSEIMALLERSWDSIFEVAPFALGEAARMLHADKADASWTYVDDIDVQACLWTIEPSYVRSWRRVVPRRAKKTSP